MNQLPKIRKGVPIKMKNEKSLTLQIQLLQGMAVGDSFSVPTDNDRKQWLRVSKRTNIPITTRKENGTGYGVWRV